MRIVTTNHKGSSLLLLSTCGASVLLNDAPEHVGWLRTIANHAVLAANDAERLQAHVRDRRRILLAANEGERRRLSAELNGIYATLARQPAQRAFHLLLHTDTAVGKAAAEVVHECLASSGHDTQLLTTGGLRTDDAEEFRQAMSVLTKELEEWLLRGEYKHWDPIIFNLTAGFKSLNAYLQALGMIHADRCVFLFEGSNQLMEIPRLPMRLAEVDEVRKHLALFRRLALGYTLPASEGLGVPESLLLPLDGFVSTSVWGDVVWRRVRDKLLSESLLEPLSPRLVLGAAVRKTFEELSTARKLAVNDALDALSAHLDGVRPLLKSHTFKKLQADPMPPATHEMYLWSDGDPGRLFGHFENGVFIADLLDGHL